jgi:DNA polymerase-3 subunit gamma/tau
LPLIEGHLKHILEQESVAFDEASIRLLAHGADGSMRDALSLMDQAIAFGGGKLEQAEVQAMLGTVSRDRVMKILQALIANDASAVMRYVAELSDLSPDYASVLAELLAMLHQMALAQKVPDAVDENLLDREALQQLANEVSSEDIQLFYQVGLLGRRDLPLAPDPRSGLEMALLRMLAFKPGMASAAGTAPAAGSNTGNAAVAQPQQAQTPQTQVQAQPQAQSPSAAATAASPADMPSSAPVQQAPGEAAAAPLKLDNNWAGLVEAMNLRGMVKQLAVNCTLKEKNATEVQLILSKEKEQLLTPGLQAKLQDALCNGLQQKLKLKISLGVSDTESPAQTLARNQAERQQSAEQSIERDPMVQALKENFNAQLVPNSVKPVDQ